MASILRQIVAGPRARHPEAGLDLCYVTDNIIATSGPSGTYPQLAYRNPLSQLVKWLDERHGDQWAIWEFRAEGTGYPDAEVYNRIHHYPWPDHHPPPFALIPMMMGSMRNWLKGHTGGKLDKEMDGQYSSKKPGRVVVVHCKAGKGRSGTVSCSYLISEEGWRAEEALKRFTERRMRPGFGAGVSIPSQLRWVSYVDRWTKYGKKYCERPVEVLEVHVWGLRDGVKVVVEGFVDQGRKIEAFHSFSKDEREIVKGEIKKNSGLADMVTEMITNEKHNEQNRDGLTRVSNEPLEPSVIEKVMKDAQREPRTIQELAKNTGDVIFRPAKPIILQTSDVNIDFERRNNAGPRMSMVTSVAHVWFNAFFEGQGPEKDGEPDTSGVFEIEWDAMDGIKGSSRKGTKAFDRLAVVWKVIEDKQSTVIINEATEEEGIQETGPVDWRHGRSVDTLETKDLGLRGRKPGSAEHSRASSTGADQKNERESGNALLQEDDNELEKVQSYLEDTEDHSVVRAPRTLLPLSKDLPGPTHGSSDPERTDR